VTSALAEDVFMAQRTVFSVSAFESNHDVEYLVFGAAACLGVDRPNS
jgi:hypothetical protein